MPNHVHALIIFENSGKNINTIVGNGKCFIAYDLVKQLIVGCFSEVLESLRGWVNSTDRFAIKSTKFLNLHLIGRNAISNIS